MRIVIEFYRDFIGTVNEERISLNKQIEALDQEDYFEYNTLSNQFESLTCAQEYFMNSERWSEFKSLDILKLYVEAIEYNYKSMCAYSKSVLPVDGGELVGITDEEWNELESMRYELGRKWIAWTYFVDFCEYGEIR